MPELTQWSDYPGLTIPRLSYVAGRIVKARAGCVALHDPQSGDNGWSLGCRAYIRSCFEIRLGTDEFDWLTVLPDAMPLRLTFAIDGWPIRFYRGDVATVPARYLAVTTAEASQQKLVFEDAEIAPMSRMLRLAVLTRVTGEVLAVQLVEFDTMTKLPIRTLDIPLLDQQSVVTPITSPKPGVVLPPVGVTPIAAEDDNSAAASGDGQ